MHPNERLLLIEFSTLMIFENWIHNNPFISSSHDDVNSSEVKNLLLNNLISAIKFF